MRIFLLLVLFWGLSIVAIGQDIDFDISQHSESKTYQAQTIISYHKVGKGETLYTIAKLNEVSIEDIRFWNNLSSNNVPVGSSLRIQKIDYILVENIELREPELLAISMDENFAASIFADYVKRTNENNFTQNLAIKECSFKQGELLSIANNIEHRIKQNNKKNIFNNISNTANTAFQTVKNWGGSVIDKIKPQKEKQTEIFYADNLSEKEESTLEKIKENNLLELNVEIPTNPESEINKEEFFKNSSDFKKIYHRVRIGETMTQIAHRYNVSKEDIIRWNNLNSNIAKIKQRLLIYTPKASAALTSEL